MIPAPAEASFGRSTVPSAFVFAAHVLLTLITAFEIGLPSAVTFSFCDGALASTPALGKAQDLADFLAVLRTQGVGPGLSDEEFFDTLPDPTMSVIRIDPTAYFPLQITDSVMGIRKQFADPSKDFFDRYRGTGALRTCARLRRRSARRHRRRRSRRLRRSRQSQ